MMNEELTEKGRKIIPLWGVHCLMLISTAIVSSSFTVGKAITNGLDPAVLVLVRFLIASLLFAPIVIAKHGINIPPIRRLAGYSSISLCTVSFFWCMFESLKYTSALNTSVIFTLVPGISGVYSAIFLRERLGQNRLLALAIGMTGALWVIFRGELRNILAMEINYGDLIFLAGCFFMAAYTPLVKKVHRKEPMMVMTFWVLTTGAGWLLLFSAGQIHAIEWLPVSPHVWLGIIYLATFSTIITFYLNHIATLHLGPTRVMAYSYFYPSFVLLLDWSIGKGLPPLKIVPGVLVVTLATVVLQRGGILIKDN